MSNERAVLCGRVPEGSLPVNDRHPLRLWAWGPNRNVYFKIKDFSEALYQDLPARFRDLLDVAVYVYCADQACKRGDNTFRDYGADWRRRLFFRIAVRDPDFWNSAAVGEVLTATLSFLSEDEYLFEFVALRKDEPFQECFEFVEEDHADRFDEVVLFSGGIDSLGGAVQEALVDRKHVALVNHRSSEKMVVRHRQLLQLLRQQPGIVRPAHFRVRINKDKRATDEYTQRSRSFLYVALGATVASMLRLRRVRFYENGVVSLNLPPSAQVVGARATRTTHPQVLNGFERLLTLVANKTFEVENPFLWKTKAEVLRLIAGAGAAALLSRSTSCTHTWTMSNEHPHCGTCSQCIDRRFAVLAAGQEAHDPAPGYGVDLLLGERAAGEGRTMLAAYLELANQVERMSMLQFFERFGEASRVFRHAGNNAEATAHLVYDLYRRHASDVTGVVDRAGADHVAQLRLRQLPAGCLLGMVYGPVGATAGGGARTPPAPPPPARNAIGRRGRCWFLRFDGQEGKPYPDDIGFHYLEVLLTHSGVPYSAAQLDCDVRRRVRDARLRTAASAGIEGEDGVSTDGVSEDEILDRQGRENFSTRLAEIEEQIAALRESTLPTRLDEIEVLQHEREWISAELRKSRERTGEPRKLGDERNRVRNRVCNAIRRALDQIKKYDPRLGEHLVRPVLNLGHTISYVPRDGTTWASPPDLAA